MLDGKMRPLLLAIAVGSIIILMTTPSSLAAVRGPFTLIWDADLVGSQRYSGGRVALTYLVTNACNSRCPVTIDSIAFNTPWRTYTDNSLPLRVNHGQFLSGSFTVDIPSSREPGNFEGTFQISWRFWTGSRWAAGNDVSSTRQFLIRANPDVAQSQVDSLESDVRGLQTSNTILTQDIADKDLQLSRLTSELQATKSELQTTKSDLETTNSDLATIKASVDGLTRDLAETREQLSSFSRVVLPFAVLLPAGIALLIGRWLGSRQQKVAP